MDILDKYGCPVMGSIALQTRKRRDIKNYFYGDLHWGQLQYFIREIREKYENETDIIFRTGPIPFYNCHGLVFASRRTWIEAGEEIINILSDDNYAKVDITDVLPGDIIIYQDTKTNSIVHSGIVLKTESDNFANPIILSKWARFAEVIHRARSGIYAKYNVKYYRIENES